MHGTAHHHDVVSGHMWDLLVAHNTQICAKEDNEGSPLMDVEPMLKRLCIHATKGDMQMNFMPEFRGITAHSQTW